MVTDVAVIPGADAALVVPEALPQAADSNAAIPPAAITAQVLDLLISGRMRVLLVCAGTGCRSHGEGASGAVGSAPRRLVRTIRVTPRTIDATPPATPRGNRRMAAMRTMP